MTGVVRFSRARVPSVSATQWEKIASLLEKQQWVLPHEVANAAGANRSVAIAVMLSLAGDEAADLKFAVYHTCSEAPVAYRDSKEGLPGPGWTCPDCGEEVGLDALRFDLVCVPRAQIEFVE